MDFLGTFLPPSWVEWADSHPILVGVLLFALVMYLLDDVYLR